VKLTVLKFTKNMAKRHSITITLRSTYFSDISIYISPE